ncbi:MAG: T9SS type A sorting domain-containing protein [Bacteroidota bacterium]
MKYLIPKLIIVVLICCSILSLSAQETQTANDYVQDYDGHFRFGMNQGYFPPWNDKQLAEIAAGSSERGIPGVGVRALRPSLPEWLMEIYGYDFRKTTYEYYETLGMTDHTVIVEGPADWHRDLYNYCGNGNDNDKSRLFANMYTPIWDNGENGTPVNDTNYLALYLWKTVNIYKDHIRFYEIWNEPDFFFYGNIWNYRDPNNTWWVRNPDPCEYQLHAPIFHYVRTLRISYEVIKSVDPDAFVSIGALGMPHFLDAVLRNTDNPVDGTPTEEYPLGGGAYFDVMGYHEYPHIDGSLWTYDFRTDNGPHSFLRNSDRAVENGIYRKKNEFERVLFDYGYDGDTYPEKHWIITESNVPRTAYNDPRYYGSDEMQRNYIIKAAIGAMKENILQFHPFTLGDKKSEAEANYEFDLMGMYKKLGGSEVYSQEVNNVGIAYKTASDLLFKTRYDDKRTADMQLPEGVEGGAFIDREGNYTYVLWAKTTLDKSEEARAMYAFPESFDIETLDTYPWNWSYDHSRAMVSASTGLMLTGTPVFFRVKSTTEDCICDDVYEPVCGSDGVEYANACEAACAGVSSFELGLCALPEDYMDLEIMRFEATPNPFQVYNRVTFSLEVANRGSIAAEDVVIEFPIPKGVLAYVGATASQGRFRVAARKWDVGTLAAGESASLDFTLFTLVREDISVYAQIVTASPEDIDSTPNNGNGSTAVEDDEAQLSIEYGGNNPTIFTQNEVHKMRLSPNPTAGQLLLSLPTSEVINRLEIVDVQGKTWQSFTNLNKVHLNLDVAELPSGLYFVLAFGAQGVMQERFVKE